MSLLKPSHIKAGALIWYSGSTSTFSWDCPAVITKVDEKKKEFWVRSLDDMRDQHQKYHFKKNLYGSGSRESMRPASREEVARYLVKQKAAWEADYMDAQDAFDTAKRNFEQFRKGLAALPEEVRMLLPQTENAPA